MALYSFTFFVFSPQFIPGPLTLVLTVLIFIFIFSLFSKIPYTDSPITITSPPIDFREFIKYSWVTWLSLLLIFPFIAGLVIGILVLSYLSLLAFGTLVFIWICSKYFLSKRKRISLNHIIPESTSLQPKTDST